MSTLSPYLSDPVNKSRVELLAGEYYGKQVGELSEDEAQRIATRIESTESPLRKACAQMERDQAIQRGELPPDMVIGRGGLLIQKAAGEGSRGGHVIGHTKSGKPVYSHEHYAGLDGALAKKDAGMKGAVSHYVGDLHANFTDADHRDAAKLHDHVASGIRQADPAYGRHYEIAAAHRQVARAGFGATVVQHAEDTNPGKPRGLPAGKGLPVGKRPELFGKAAGEGSRGGHIIGHTRSGKPVYGHGHAAYGVDPNQTSHGDIARHLEQHYPGFTAADHRDASKAHGVAALKDLDAPMSEVKAHSQAGRLHDAASKLAPADPKSASTFPPASEWRPVTQARTRITHETPHGEYEISDNHANGAGRDGHQVYYSPRDKKTGQVAGHGYTVGHAPTVDQVHSLAASHNSRMGMQKALSVGAGLKAALLGAALAKAMAAAPPPRPLLKAKTAGANCPTCGANGERDSYRGKCNRCGKSWPGPDTDGDDDGGD